jgi:hypothetical protein
MLAAYLSFVLAPTELKMNNFILAENKTNVRRAKRLRDALPNHQRKATDLASGMMHDDLSCPPPTGGSVYQGGNCKFIPAGVFCTAIRLLTEHAFTGE